MKLTKQEIGMGCIIVTCTCCGEVYKSHMQANALSYGWMPNYGCGFCQGIPPEENLQKSI